jgi:tetraacyldisaccharide 4'-kinase
VAFSVEDYHALIHGRQRGIRAALLRGGLTLASLPYGVAVSMRNWLYDRGWKKVHRASVPVVSVGNLTLGGTGKTPCVEYLARFFREHEVRVAILSRGYGAERGRNDEALVLEENLPDVPHLQGADRVELAHTAVEELESELLLLDDGFQHRRLARDLDVVLVDATDPWGPGHLFPRGTLREPRRGLRRAHGVVLTRCDQAPAETTSELRRQLERFAPQALVVETRHSPRELTGSNGRTESLETLSDRPVSAFCGIGNPAAFRRTLEGLGARIGDFRTYPDHHPYTRNDVEELQRWAAEQQEDVPVLTTQKDLVKLRVTELGGRALWAVRIGLQVDHGEELLQQRLRALLPPA